MKNVIKDVTHVNGVSPGYRLVEPAIMELFNTMYSGDTDLRLINTEAVPDPSRRVPHTVNDKSGGITSVYKRIPGTDYLSLIVSSEYKIVGFVESYLKVYATRDPATRFKKQRFFIVELAAEYSLRKIGTKHKTKHVIFMQTDGLFPAPPEIASRVRNVTADSLTSECLDFEITGIRELYPEPHNLISLFEFEENHLRLKKDDSDKGI